MQVDVGTVFGMYKNREKGTFNSLLAMLEQAEKLAGAAPCARYPTMQCLWRVRGSSDELRRGHPFAPIRACVAGLVEKLTESERAQWASRFTMEDLDDMAEQIMADDGGKTTVPWTLHNKKTKPDGSVREPVSFNWVDVLRVCARRRVPAELTPDTARLAERWETVFTRFTSVAVPHLSVISDGERVCCVC